MDDQRDMVDEQLTREALRREAHAEWADGQALKPLAVRIAEYCETDQGRIMSILSDTWDVIDQASPAGTFGNGIAGRKRFQDALIIALTDAERRMPA